jgi:ribosome-binding factor A
MESTRQHKIARLIQKDLSDIFLRYAKRIGNVLISVSEVRVSPDLSVASVYLSIFPDNREKELMDKISEDTSAIRGQLGTLERHQLRIIPELRFFADETIQRMEHIDELLKK